MNAILFSLPGTPFIYSGEEIGMGDNYYLGDRNGVRTPMQWSPDRNAGFSKANPQKLYLPVIIDPEYHYESVNVENQQRNPSSLLWWMKRAIAIRKRLKSPGRGTMEFLFPENSKVLAFIRSYKDESPPGRCQFIQILSGRGTRSFEIYRHYSPDRLQRNEIPGNTGIPLCPDPGSPQLSVAFAQERRRDAEPGRRKGHP